MALATAEFARSEFTHLRQPAAVIPARRSWPSVLCLVLLCTALRLPGITRPLVGHFATKNATYAMIARNWALGRAPLWRPTTDCMAGGDRGWHLLEVPVAAYLAGAGWAICGGSLDVWGRAVSIAFSAVSVVLMFLLVRRWHSQAAGYAAGLTLALSPASIIYGQSFMLEASVVCFAMATLLAFDVWLGWQREGFRVQGSGFRDARLQNGLLAIAAVSFALLLLTKIYMLVLLLPLAAMVRCTVAGCEKQRSNDNRSASCRMTFLGRLLRSKRTTDDLGRSSYESLDRSSLPIILGTGMLLLSAIPAVAWCAAAMHLANPTLPHSQHVFDSLYRSTTVHHWPHPLLASGEFYARLLYNLALPGLTPLPMLMAFIGLASRAGRRHAWWLAAMALLVAALPAKFYELQYYTLILVPPLAVLAGVGWESVLSRYRPPRAAVALCVLAWSAISMRAAVGPAFTTPAEDRGVTAAAAAVRQLATTDEPVATLHGASSDLLHYCDRPGWALSTNDRHLMQRLDECRRQGARWLVVADLKALAASPSSAEMAGLPMVREGDNYRVYQLSEHHRPQNPGNKR
ncbi:MAG TPA: glycosyltransferase family 39 protein [Pirellulales bacterium]|nr:glycosyltransferase family 39 protein [Pirellulales bacterium]